jgi:hypothetical protein
VNVNINFLPYLVIWIALAIAVVFLYLRHRSIASQEDAHLDVLGSATASQQQVVLEHRLEAVDKWGKILTVITVVYGLLLAGLYLYQTWVQMSRVGV